MANVSQIGVNSGKAGHFGAHQKRIHIQFVSTPYRQQRRSNEDGRWTSSLICLARRERDPIIAPLIQTKGEQEEYVDLNSHLLRNRIIFLGERINDQVAVKTVASLLALNSLSMDEEIKLYINCAAGSSYAVVSILDTLRAIKAPVSTVAFGMVGGNAVQILAAGTKGRRYSMPNTRIMLQQPNGGAQGSADEVNIQTTELNRTMRMMYKFLSESTGLPQDKIEEECDRENFLSPKQAIELGIIDGVIG